MHVRSFVFVLLLFCAPQIRARDEAKAPGLTLERLQSELAEHVGEARFRAAQWGIKIQSLATGTVLFETNADKLLKPASNAKLYTGALALDALGPDYRIQTSLFSKGAVKNGVLKGDLILYGRGDPSFSVRFEKVGYTNLLSPIVQELRKAGIQKIEGDLVGDSTYFSGAPYGSGWTWDDLQYYYGAEVSALSVQDNVIDLVLRPGGSPGAPCQVFARPQTDFVEIINRARTAAPRTASTISIERPLGERRAFIGGTLPQGLTAWSDAVTVPNPTLWFVTILARELADAGIAVTGRPRALISSANGPTDTATLREIGRVQSPPLGEIVHSMMKASQNLYAQLLLLQVGVRSAKPWNGNTTEELGLRRMGEFVERAGIRRGDVLLDDGAGLSRSGMITAGATVQLLRAMAKHPAAEVFKASLPEAGTDGTLRTRLKELKGRLRAKTGTLQFVNTLSGYITTDAGEELAFSILLNAYNPVPGTNRRDEVDAIPRLIARLKERTKGAAR